MTTYTRRQLRDITQTALELLAREGSGAGQTMRDQARAALAQLDGQQPARRELVWREQVQPGLWVVIEDSHNILLELTTPDGAEVLARTDPIGVNDLAVAVTVARVKVAELDDEAERQRLAGLRDKLRADLAPHVTDETTASLADAIAEEFGLYGITGIEFAPGDEG